jgi:dGTPase
LRRFATSSESVRSPFQRDRDRIIHASAFRKLQHKTQVFVAHEGDNYRTRLTHSIEVAQIARSISVALRLDEDLAEAVALAHDLGHTPFGHAGEDALSACLKALGQPAFDHNDQAVRIVTQLEHHYADFPGLNLTWDILEGIAKHNGPLKGALPGSIAAEQAAWDLQPRGYASAEAQVAALSDDIAYNNHDIDDGVRVGLLALEDFCHLPLLGETIAQVQRLHPLASAEQRRHEVLRRTIDAMVKDVLVTSQARLAALPEASVAAVRAASGPVIGFSPEMDEAIRQLRRFLFDNLYRHFQVNRMRVKAMRVVQQLFDYYHQHPESLPDPWRGQALGCQQQADLTRLVVDYIAGMTDSLAVKEHSALFDTYSMFNV